MAILYSITTGTYLYGNIDFNKLSQYFLKIEFDVKHLTNQLNVKKRIDVEIKDLNYNQNVEVDIILRRNGFIVFTFNLPMEFQYFDSMKEKKFTIPEFNLDNHPLIQIPINFMLEFFNAHSLSSLQFELKFKNKGLIHELGKMGINFLTNYSTIFLEDSYLFLEESESELEDVWNKLKAEPIERKPSLDTPFFIGLDELLPSISPQVKAIYRSGLCLKSSSKEMLNLINESNSLMIVKKMGMSVIENLLNEIEHNLNKLFNYTYHENPSWIYIQEELNDLNEMFRRIITSFERSIVDLGFSRNVMISRMSDDYLNLEKIHLLPEMRENYYTKKSRITELLSDLHRNVDFKSEEEQKLASNRLVQVISIFAAVQIFLEIFNVLNSNSFNVPIIMFSSLIIISIVTYSFMLTASSKRKKNLAIRIKHKKEQKENEIALKETKLYLESLQESDYLSKEWLESEGIYLKELIQDLEKRAERKNVN